MILLQWIAFHVNLEYKDIADDLAKCGTSIILELLAYLELYSKYDIKERWVILLEEGENETQKLTMRLQLRDFNDSDVIPPE
ncbi:hypothetical protein TNCT_138771 [Trichonephila clavata]|uniref:Uncharacterized protein n=1 Tax=Trichonephila clavata TaxID=2740835 RepID=A0A8X6J9W2_TRICU|nr:hypothetical protein TNCT_138771 [Trichonephila clavata]